MGYTWTRSVAVGESVSNLAVQEIRTAIDYVKDNPCTTHNVAQNLSELTGHCPVAHEPHCPTNHPMDDGTQHSGNDTTHHPGYCSGLQSSNLGTDQVGHNHSNYTGYHNADYADHNDPYHSGNLGGNNSVYRSGYELTHRHGYYNVDGGCTLN